MHEHHVGNINEDELTALLQYNARHNASHISELEEISVKLTEQGKENAHEKMESAIKKLREANALILEALNELK